MFYTSLLAALAGMDVRIRPVWLPRGAERAARAQSDGSFVISFHSHGPAGRIVRCKESYVYPYYTMDRMGYSCFSELALHPDAFADRIARQDPATARAFVRQLAVDMRQNNRSKYKQPAYGQPEDGGYVFIPLQVRNDSVASAAWLDIGDAIRTIRKAAAERGLKVVIKRHPRCSSGAVSHLLAEFDDCADVVVSTASVNELIGPATLVAGANSGVLFEALIQQKPVVCFGDSDYASIAHVVKTHDDLHRAVLAPQQVTNEQRDKFIYWYLNEYAVRSDDVGTIRRRLTHFMNIADNAPSSVAYSPGRYRLGLYLNSLFDRIQRRLF